MKRLQQNDQGRLYAEIIEFDVRSEKQILDWSANKILELDCEKTKQVLVSKSKMKETVSRKGTN